MKCLCNCGHETKPGNRYIHGHNEARKRATLADMGAWRNEETGCLLYLGSINPVSGYGYLSHRPAHRIAYEEAYGPIPSGLTIDHVYARGCRYKNCIEPSHLEAVSRAENNRRAAVVRTRRTHCKQGHELSGRNLRVRHKGSYLERICRRCVNDRSNAAYHAKRAALRSGMRHSPTGTPTRMGGVSGGA
jgi:hypothetical protein